MEIFPKFFYIPTIMTYSEAVTYLFESAPLFQQIGKAAYKEGLENTYILDEHFGHPHRKFRTIHIGGTNGKGSCSHTIAAILQDAGYRVGLYTSPHLVDFRERIRINGNMISQQRVIDFVENERSFFEPLHPSFFELTTALAFQYFAEEKVDVAVIEVGLGGRLDCTNIIMPDLSVITNISFDHTQFLGNTLHDIATEKAGIIKANTPVVIGETQPETAPVFKERAQVLQAPIFFGDQNPEVLRTIRPDDFSIRYETRHYGTISGALTGYCQERNTNTILCAVRQLQQNDFYQINDANIASGMLHVCQSTGLRGRWEIVSKEPVTICDTGHNAGGMVLIAEQLRKLPCNRLRIVIGMVNDKDIHAVLALLPEKATYYFTQASVKRALDASVFAKEAGQYHLQGKVYKDVRSAYRQAVTDAASTDIIFVGGSTFIVADFLATCLDEKTIQ